MYLKYGPTPHRLTARRILDKPTSCFQNISQGYTLQLNHFLYFFFFKDNNFLEKEFLYILKCLFFIIRGYICPYLYFFRNFSFFVQSQETHRWTYSVSRRTVFSINQHHVFRTHPKGIPFS